VRQASADEVKFIFYRNQYVYQTTLAAAEQASAVFAPYPRARSPPSRSGFPKNSEWRNYK